MSSEFPELYDFNFYPWKYPDVLAPGKAGRVGRNWFREYEMSRDLNPGDKPRRKRGRPPGKPGRPLGKRYGRRLNLFMSQNMFEAIIAWRKANKVVSDSGAVRSLLRQILGGHIR